MVHRAIIIAWVCCFFVVASFSLFAIDHMAGASKHQQNEITSSAIQPIPPEAQHHGQPRQFIDDAAHTLASPARSIVQSDSQWVLRGVPSIVALLVYGVGLGYLARFSRGWGRRRPRGAGTETEIGSLMASSAEGLPGSRTSHL